MDSLPIAITSLDLSSSPFPEPLRQLLQTRHKASLALLSPLLSTELSLSTPGPQASLVLSLLTETLQLAQSLKSKVTSSGRKLTVSQEARGEFVLAWTLGRIGEYDGTPSSSLPTILLESLSHYSQSASLLSIPQPPPLLSSFPSVTRPNNKTGGGGGMGLELPMVEAWVGEMLTEWARTQTTLAFMKVLEEGEGGVEEDELADLLDLACRRNVQALFTPVDPTSSTEDSSPSEASTVMANANLIRDMSLLMPFTSSETMWNRRIAWATHVADVKFVEASMSANRLIDFASASTSILSSPSPSPTSHSSVRSVLEATIRRLVPLEKAQGTCLLNLGRTMLEAVGALYMGQEEVEASFRGRKGGRREESRSGRRDGEEGEDGREGDRKEVPENELVRETRQVLIRAAGMFENSFANLLKTPESSRKARDEQKLLRRLETTYCNLEELDNSSPEVVQLREERVARALWINDRLVALGDGEDEDDVEEDESDDDEDGEGEGESEVDSEEEELRRRFGRSQI